MPQPLDPDNVADSDANTAIPEPVSDREAWEDDLDSVDPQDNDRMHQTNLMPAGTFVVLATLFFAAMLFAPKFIGALANLGRPDVKVALGTVQRIHFIGGLGRDTQIDTESHSLLVNGIAHVQPGTKLEQRKGFWGTEVCARDTGACWELLSQ